MECKKYRGVWKYTAEDYSFKFIDEKLHEHSTLLIKPKHLRILSNTTTKSNEKLKTFIIDSHFHAENEYVREHNNAVARKRRERKRVHANH